MSIENSSYMNDPVGHRPARLTDVQVENPRRLLDESISILADRLVRVDRSRIFVAQNLTTHFAHMLSAIRERRPDIQTVYVSDHEIDYTKAMLEKPYGELDVTFSNYHGNDEVAVPSFTVKVFPFEEPQAAVAHESEAAIFFISHVSRLTGEMIDIATLHRQIKKQNPDSILFVDGAQAIGAIGPIEIEDACDVYFGVSSKFIGAEPHLGLAFVSDAFFNTYIAERKLNKDIFSLHESLMDPIYQSDYQARITDLKGYAMQTIALAAADVLYVPENQAPNFLTLNFGSIERTQDFLVFAQSQGVELSDNIGWSIGEAKTPLVRVGLSVRVSKSDIDRLLNVIQKFNSRV